MKLTWFGGTTIRVHIGGLIAVMDAAGAPRGIDAAELVSGAELKFASGGSELARVDAAAWRVRKAGRLIDEATETEAVRALDVGGDAVLVDAVGEAPLLLVTGAMPATGRWANDAVVVLFGDGAGMIAAGEALLERATPKLVALAGEDDAIELAVAALRGKLDGTGLFALERGMALEV